MERLTYKKRHFAASQKSCNDSQAMEKNTLFFLWTNGSVCAMDAGQHFNKQFILACSSHEMAH